MKLLTYIAGPISGLPDGNKPAFDEAEARLREAGYYVHNPHELCKDMPPGTSWCEYMRRCIRALTTCDAIYMLPGWKRSRGARIEWFVAKVLGVLVLDGSAAR